MHTYQLLLKYEPMSNRDSYVAFTITNKRRWLARMWFHVLIPFRIYAIEKQAQDLFHLTVGARAWGYSYSNGDLTEFHTLQPFNRGRSL